MNSRTLSLGASLSALLLLAACGGHDPAHDKLAAEHAAMLSADSAEAARVSAQEALARQIIDEMNNGNIDAVMGLMADDFVDHQQGPMIDAKGKEGAREWLTMMQTAMPDFNQEIVAMTTSDDLTWMHLHITGTMTGPMGDMPATGKSFDVMGLDIVRFRDGKAVEHWGYMEDIKMIEQLGMMGGEEKK